MSNMIVDTHIHPKMAEDQLFTEMERANVARCVLLAIDTDPSDIDRKEIRKGLSKKPNTLQRLDELRTNLQAR